MRPVSIARRTAGVTVEGLLVLGTIAALVLAGAVATRGEPGGAASAFAGRYSGVITVPDGVFAGTTTATANPGTEGTWAMAECSQDGTVVYRQYVKVDPVTHQATFTLGPTPLWSGGAASCRAEEGTWFKGSRWRVQASTTFNVSG
ncbi:MAG TPA: hypothetical protein VFX65_10975 [Candidatus Limnocylindrales bacterium]|nr:hypothetical protein [Candidatus Limnocylindrales bacterium]